MIPNIKLIVALRKTADEIGEREEYNWGNFSTCNCGLLARNLLNIDRESLEDIYDTASGATWTEVVSDYTSTNHKVCNATGWSIDKVVYLLKIYGIEEEDFEKLEFIEATTNKEFATQYFQLEEKVWTNPVKVAQYFRNKADELEVLLNSNTLDKETVTAVPTLKKENKQQVSCSI